ncbi:MAG: hypothetical protein C3F15_01325 [Holophagae bacterium]|nr:MAG: hypothetical protein C3F15_01325 [Holophagae bacterium]
MFPSTDQPGAEDAGICTQYFSRGLSLDADLIASHLAAHQVRSVIQVFCGATPAGTRILVPALAGRYRTNLGLATNDGSYMIGQVPGGTDAQWLQGAAVIRGANGSNRRSDVVLMSTAGDAATAEVVYFPAAQDNGGTSDQRSVPLTVGERFRGQHPGRAVRLLTARGGRPGGRDADGGAAAVDADLCRRAGHWRRHRDLRPGRSCCAPPRPQ